MVASMKRLIVIGDYCNDSLVCQELKSAVTGFLSDASQMDMSFVDSYPSTIHTAFLIYQVTQTEERYGVPKELVILVNTDPRVQTTQAVAHAEGSKGVIVRLSSGIVLIGPNAGYCFSLIKEKIESISYYEGLEKGSQFRSRDLYPKIVALLMQYKDDDLDLEEAPATVIPDVEGAFVGHVDNYGNIKTTVTKSQMLATHAFGDMVEVTLNGVTLEAKFVDNLFGGNVGELVVYPGSSGNPKDTFIEVSSWSHFGDTEGGKAAKTGRDFFNKPLPGMKLELK